MRKEWVKRENIYYKPFYKQRKKLLLLSIFLLGIIFFAHQIITINQLENASQTPWTLDGTMQAVRVKHKEIINSLGRKQRETEEDAGGGGNISNAVPASADPDAIKIIRGIRLFDYDAYKPNFGGKFKCLDGSAEIPFEHVNDDFCDCPKDGSDEPSTNACNAGRFYCKYQKRHITGRGRDVFVASSRVNDGVCDCCDGSDEWKATVCKNRCT